MENKNIFNIKEFETDQAEEFKNLTQLHEHEKNIFKPLNDDFKKFPIKVVENIEKDAWNNYKLLHKTHTFNDSFLNRYSKKRKRALRGKIKGSYKHFKQVQKIEASEGKIKAYAKRIPLKLMLFKNTLIVQKLFFRYHWKRIKVFFKSFFYKSPEEKQLFYECIEKPMEEYYNKLKKLPYNSKKYKNKTP